MRDLALAALPALWLLLILGASWVSRRPAPRTRELGRSFMAGLVGLSVTFQRREHR